MVVAPSMVEVVRFAGGWLFDRAMAGWDVTALVADRADPRPLRILGARAADLESALAAPVRGARPQAIAVCGRLYDSDARVRRLVGDVLDDGRDVRFWGDPPPAGHDPAGAVRHRLSVAARAFKAQALAAVAAPVEAGEATEVFRSGQALHPSRGTMTGTT